MGTSTKVMVAPEYILPLADSRATLANVGGKGAALARLARAGLPVPGGFHVTTFAYQQFVAANYLQQQIIAALKVVDSSHTATLESVSRAIGDLITAATMPGRVADAIAQAYGELPCERPRVAVRSSATAEDLHDYAFAGQQDTYLNVQDAAAVQDAVKRCWASLWTPRAIGYRTQHNVDHSAISIAVVVQLLVMADAAGIVFTANPVTGRRDQCVINAAWGLGEAIVGGLVTPDTLVVDKVSGQLIERDIGDKDVMTVPADEGTAERPVPELLRHAPVLDDAQIKELMRLGARIEELGQMPMDIEWALAEGKFAILQARPITALPTT
jgi:rifampicin phosphotransferase